MKTKKSLPGSVVILILSLITVIVWIGFSVYRALTETPAPVVSESVLAPVDPTLDASVLNTLQQRVYLTKQEITPLSNESLIINQDNTAPAPVEASVESDLVATEGGVISNE